jgi:apolipoprotein N-acyltransferase
MKQPSENRQKDKLSYLWLALSFVFMIFSDGRWAFALAPWLALPLLLRFVRYQKPVAGYFITVAVMTISSSIAWYGILPLPVHILMSLISGLFAALPYLADRIMARRVSGFLSTLIFPAAVTVMQFVSSFRPDLGTYGSLAYTQYGNLPLMQFASITGIWGIVFLISWFASTINYCWENGFAFERFKKAAVTYLCVLLAVFIYGGARLLLIKPAASSVRVAAVTTPSDIKARLTGYGLYGKSPFNLQESLALLESQTVKAAREGAKIIAWQEYGDLISNANIDVFLKQGQKIAADKKIYLLIDVGILDINKKEKGENATILIDPMGEIKWKYFKSYLVPAIEAPYFKKGDFKVPALDTPYGKIASVICFEYDHHRYIRSAGRGIGLFLVPALDFKELTPVHSRMALFRGIEHGFSVLKPTGEGLSIAADYCGRIIAERNYFTSKDRIMLADMSLKPVFTIYSVIGDVFAWLCVIGLIILIVVAVARRERTNITQNY